ncbi:MAG: hypothetical protein WCX28_13520, partial [Bacteriovoracaceae bacterium]
MKSSMLFLSLFIVSVLFSQDRILLHIGKSGQQEAYPLKRGEHAKDVIERLEKKKTLQINRPTQSAGMIDTLRNYSSSYDLNVNFGWNHQDVALQWFVPPAGGEVLEFWWYNYQKQGVSKKAKIQAWYVDPRVQNYPGTPITKFLGTYKDSMDGDGGVQPFKPDSGNQWFYSNGFADSIKYSFDPILKEAGWAKGGIQVTLDSNAWQGISLADYGEVFPVNFSEPFGFTITNDTKKSEIVDSTDVRMELLSAQSIASPYHSLKFYETGRTAP